jgi:hypothetical protein
MDLKWLLKYKQILGLGTTAASLFLILLALPCFGCSTLPNFLLIVIVILFALCILVSLAVGISLARETEREIGYILIFLNLVLLFAAISLFKSMLN